MKGMRCKSKMQEEMRISNIECRTPNARVKCRQARGGGLSWGLFILIATVSCTQDDEPYTPGPPDGSLNFYNASEALLQRGFTNDNVVFIDGNTSDFARFSDVVQDSRQFPEVYASYNYQVAGWMRIKKGNHRFKFTGPAYHVLGDTTVFIAEDSRHAIYLAESPGGSQAYRVIVAKEDRLGIAGKVRVRFVNLSPDAGALRCYRSLAGGSLSTAGLPQDMVYGTVTPYVPIDTLGASATRNHLVFRLVDKVDPQRVLLTASVPALPGTSFVFVIQGFRNDAERRIPYGENAVRDTAIRIQANLRVNTRRTY